MNLMPRLEEELAPPVVDAFHARGCSVLVEVPFNRRIADVVAVAEDGEVTVVELKLTAWKTALRQATAYQVGCHRSYVGLPLVTASRLLKRSGFRDAFEHAGCGLLAVNHPFGDVRELIPAAPSRRRLDYLSDYLARVGRGELA